MRLVARCGMLWDVLRWLQLIVAPAPTGISVCDIARAPRAFSPSSNRGAVAFQAVVARGLWWHLVAARGISRPPLRDPCGGCMIGAVAWWPRATGDGGSIRCLDTWRIRNFLPLRSSPVPAFWSGAWTRTRGIGVPFGGSGGLGFPDSPPVSDCLHCSS